MIIKAPEFEAIDDEGNVTTLSQYRGQNLILFFYPKDFTPTCVVDAYVFKHILSGFIDKNLAIVGVSRDTVRSHQRFKKVFKLPFKLLCDPDAEIGALYKIYRDKSVFGRCILSIQRSTFLINTRGDIVDEWRNVMISAHIQEVKSAIEKVLTSD